MTLTKSQKLYAAVLGLGLCALGADHLSGSNERHAEGATAAVPTTAEPLSAMSGAVAVTPVGRRPLAARLRAVSTANQPGDGPRDAFRTSAAWLTAAAGPLIGWNERLAKFRRAHVLKAITSAGGRGQAWVDGSLISVGESIDGFQLTRVESMRAVFVADGRQVDLVLPGVVAGSN